MKRASCPVCPLLVFFVLPLALLQRVAQSTEGADDLRNAVNAMDLVSKKILDALGPATVPDL